MTVIAAPSGDGKSAFLGASALRQLEAQRRVLFVTAEMPTIVVVRRMLSSLSGVPYSTLRRGGLGVKNLQRIEVAMSRLFGYLTANALEIIEPRRSPLDEIAAAARRMRSRGGLDVICADYLQRLAPIDAHEDSRHLAVASVSDGLSELAKRLDVAVIAVAQTVRDFHGANPSLAVLGESHAIARDADAVVLFWQEGGNDDHIEAKVCKSRHGPSGARMRIPIDLDRMRVGSAAAAEEAAHHG
jgi:replicative DNA helicase